MALLLAAFLQPAVPSALAAFGPVRKGGGEGKEEARHSPLVSPRRPPPCCCCCCCYRLRFASRRPSSPPPRAGMVAAAVAGSRYSEEQHGHSAGSDHSLSAGGTTTTECDVMEAAAAPARTSSLPLPAARGNFNLRPGAQQRGPGGPGAAQRLCLAGPGPEATGRGGAGFAA